jgi:zinc protease
MAIAAASRLKPLAEGLVLTELGNGLRVAALPVPDAPGVATALWYGVGARDEQAGELGAAHFLEHMMFKGSAHFGPGELDHRTQGLGGSNNAFTSHDATVYWFRLPPERWTEALVMEADRMAGLRLDPEAVESEREVVVEEISMYASDPWDALEQAVLAALWGEHPYARPILGTAESLAGLGPEQLRAFHRAAYSPDRALLLVAGAVTPAGVMAAAEANFGAIPRGSTPRPKWAPARGPASRLRVERQLGELARLMLAIPAPAAGTAEHAVLRVLAATLGSGRASRLHRRLVEIEQLCAWVAVQLGEGVAGSVLSVSAELHPGIAPALVEGIVVAELERLALAPPEGEELERVRRMLRADFVFGHEATQERALAVAGALAVGDLDQPNRSLEEALAADSSTLARAAARHLTADAPAVVGWSLPGAGR